MEHELGRDVLAQRAHHARHLAPAEFRAAQLYRRGRGRGNVKGGGAGREDGCRDAGVGGRGMCGIEEDDGAQFAARLLGPDREHQGCGRLFRRGVGRAEQRLFGRGISTGG